MSDLGSSFCLYNLGTINITSHRRDVTALYFFLLCHAPASVVTAHCRSNVQFWTSRLDVSICRAPLYVSALKGQSFFTFWTLFERGLWVQLKWKKIFKYFPCPYFFLPQNWNSYPHLGQNVLFQGLFPRYCTRKLYMLGSFTLNCSLVVGAALSGALASKKPCTASAQYSS